jgi:cell division septation protein DedD
LKLDGFISDLLYDHDCVIVTGLGGFIAQYQPASINQGMNIISPPSKKLAFNSSLKNNDGLLANHISNRESLSYTDACHVINTYVAGAKSSLELGKKLKIENVGVLFFDKNSQMQFQPDQQVNYLVSSFGLSPVHAPVIKKVETVEEFETYLEPEDENHDEPTKLRERKPIKWNVLEVVPAAAMLTWLLMMPPVLEKVNDNLSTLLPFSRINEYIDEFKGIHKEYTVPEVKYFNPFEVPPADAEQNSTITEESATPVPTEEVVTPVTESVSAEPVPAIEPVKAQPAQPVQVAEAPAKAETGSFSSDSRFHIIGGSFRSLDNAERFVNDMKSSKSLDAQIIGQNSRGLYMVSLLASDSFDQVTDALSEVRTTSGVSGSWIYTRQ